MNHLRKLQVGLLVAAAVVFVFAVLTGLGWIPVRPFRLTTGGWHRVADTLLYFSIATGLVWMVLKKE